MKFKLSVFAPLMVLGLGSFAQGITFSHLTYDEAIAKARAEKKAIFVDAYTTWCGPCKTMARTVFTQKQVGDYFNANFVNLKLDAENESTHGFFKRYKASVYPTYFWINAEGELLDTKTGAVTADVFLGYAKEAATSRLAVQQKQYAERWAKGERSYELVDKYVYGILSKIKPSEVYPHVESYVASLNDKQMQDTTTSRLLRGYMRIPEKGVILDAILKYHNAIEKNIGYLEYNQSMYRMVVRAGSSALSQKQDTTYHNHIALMKASPIPQKEMYLQILEGDSLLYTENYNQGINKMYAIAAKYGKDNPFLYREFSYTFVSSGLMAKAKLEPQELDRLIELNTKTFELNPSKEAVTFLAAAYAKKGDYKKAYEIASATDFYNKPSLPGGLFGKFLNLPTKVYTTWGSSDEGKAIKAAIANKIKEQGGTR